VNSEKIIWSENALQELERLFGSREFEIEEIEDALGSLDFPWPITVKSLTAEKDVTGETWSNLIIEFDEISGAGGYQVRMDLVPTEDNQYEVSGSTNYVTYSSTYGGGYTFEGNNYYEHSFSLADDSWAYSGTFTSTQWGVWEGQTRIAPTTIESGDIGILICADHTVDWSGGFQNWTKIVDPSAPDEKYKGAVWLGYGVGSGDVENTPGPNLWDMSRSTMVVIKNYEYSQIVSALDDIYLISNSPQPTSITESVSTQPGDIVIFGSWTAGGGLDDWRPIGGNTVTGLTGVLGVAEAGGPSYANGSMLTIGIATGTSAEITARYYTDGGDAGGSFIKMVLRSSGTRIWE
jgi:hypothetical protein